MVDKENQWENIQYSNEQETDNLYEYDDSSNDSSGAIENDGNQDYDTYEEYEDEPVQKKNNPLPVILIFLILLGAGAFFVVPKFMNGGTTAGNESVQNQSIDVSSGTDSSSQQQTSSDLANAFFDEAGGENADMMSVNFNENGETNVVSGEGENVQVATVTDTTKSEGISETDLFSGQSSSDLASNEENNSIMVVYNKAARINPFKPPVVETSMDQAYETINDTQFEIIEPPVASVPDENLTRLLQTQISGILYDEESPSAIINLNGLDQFVKAGDTISGYKVESITKDRVQISYKNNSYVASVGELFTRGSLEKRPAVANLENKFAGRYRNQNN